MANGFLSKLSLFSGSDTVVGLSIGSTAIKIVELKKTKNTWKLIHFGMIQLPEDVIVNREIINNVAVTDSLRTLAGQVGLKNKNVCTGISGTSLIIKRMMLDIPNKNDLESQIFWEAEQYLPFDVAEVVMDYQILSRGKDNKTDVLLVALKSSVLDSYTSVIEGAGLKPKTVDLDFFALQNLFEVSYPAHVANRPGSSEAVALVDVGGSATKIVVIHGGIPVFTKDSTMGGRNLTAEIQKHLSLSYADAETLKTGNQGHSVPQEVSELTHVMAENIGLEIKRAIDFYNASSAGAPVSSVLLAGGTAKIAELSRLVEEQLGGLPTMLMNPFNAITFDPAVFTQDYLNAIAPLAVIPIGLALRAAEK